MRRVIGKETSLFSKLVGAMAGDERLLATHVNLFTAIFVSWQRSGFSNPFSVSRRKLMAYSKIASIATYHKCIRELNAYGYILYQPSFHPHKGSLVYWPEEMPRCSI